MKTVIQDLNGNLLLLEETSVTSTSHSFFMTDGVLVRLTRQWEPDRLLILDYVKDLVHNGVAVSAQDKQATLAFLSFYFSILLVEDIAIFRKESMSCSGEVYVADEVTDMHIKEVKKLYDTSNWIWP